ncbi:MAG: response regulator [Rhodopirellula sp.]|nr:response regulator [Rhodopirellula sp.]
MKTILLADDSKNIREFCRQELEEDGYRVITAKDGLEAIHAAKTQRPDAAILDIRMPRSGGLDAIEQIRRFDADLPVILFTSHDDACLDDARSRLATACVEKSEDLSELKRAVLRAMSRDPVKRSFRFGLRSPFSLRAPTSVL